MNCGFVICLSPVPHSKQDPNLRGSLSVLKDKSDLLSTEKDLQLGNIPIGAMCCCHDPLLIEECASAKDRDCSVAPWFRSGQADLPSDLALDGILAANNSMNPVICFGSIQGNQ